MKQIFNALSGAFDAVLNLAEEILYDNGTSGLTATNVQDAIDELEAEIAALPTPITYQGTWNAATNTPTLSNADTGKLGFLYQVTVAGTVDFGAGPISFDAGDKVVNNGSIWEKWDQTDAVMSVNSQTGVVVLDTDDISEGATNLYFTNTRARDAIVGGASTIVSSNLTIDRALVSDVSGKVAVATTTATEIGYVNGVTSAIQTQLNAKQSTTLTDAFILVGNGSNIATAVAVSGDLTLANTGAFTIANLAVTNSKIANATIDLTTKVTGVLPVANGGTGSATQNFVDLTTAQSIAGDKNFTSSMNAGGFLSMTPQNDAIATGADATVTPSTRSFVRLTNGSLTSVSTIGATDTGRTLTLSNVTGNSITINNEGTGTANQRILTGTGANITLANNASISLVYDNTTARWRVIASVGSSLATPVSLANGGTNKALTAAAGGIVYTDADSMEITAAGTADQYLKSNGSSAPTWATFTPPTVQRLTSGTTYTTPANVKWLKVTAVGGGGGGGGSSTTAGLGTAGGTGGSTTFGTSLITSTGGTGGDRSGNSFGFAVGGTSTINSPALSVVSYTGENGTPPGVYSGVNNVIGGRGGGGFLGSGGVGQAQGSSGGNGNGGGGSGGGTGGSAGFGGTGGGAGGFSQAIIPSPAASYTYAIGAAGTAGTAGTGGFGGAAGSVGIIIVEEYYQ